MTTEPLLVLDRVSVAYAAGSIQALDDVSLQVRPGQIVVMLGANGAGKTTAMRAIFGLLPVHGGALTGGRIRYEGADIAGRGTWDLVRAGISAVLEGRRIFAELTVAENLRAGGYVIRRQADYGTALDRVFSLFPRLAERRAVRAGLLSGGEQQMLAIGRALLQAPRLLLLDEPSLGLAPKVVEQIRDVIVDINRQGTSVVLIEQNAAMALSIADHAYVVEQRRIMRTGGGPELLADPSIRQLYLGGGAAAATAPAAGPGGQAAGPGGQAAGPGGQAAAPGPAGDRV